MIRDMQTTQTSHGVSAGTDLTRPRTLLIGLIGEGVTPSLTPPMHELEGRRHGISYVYRPINTTAEEANSEVLESLIAAAERFGFHGLNITHPYKQMVLPLLHEVSDDASRLGAVNTVRLTNGKRVGFNTDASGFGGAFAEHLGDAAHEQVILLGAGGAGSAVAAALLAHPVANLIVIDQDFARAQALAELADAWGPGSARAVPAEDLPAEIAEADGIVNATPFGMAAYPGAAFDLDLLHERLWVADIVYRPSETLLLREARARGLRTMSGLSMAMGQAAEAFEIFTGNRADRDAMLGDLRGLIAAEAAEV